MKKTIILSGQRIEYNLTRKKVKNINLRIKSDGSVNVSANNRVSAEYIERFLLIHEDFILNALERFEAKKANMPKPQSFECGELVAVLGRKVPLIVVKSSKNVASFQKEDLMLAVKDINDIEAKRKTLDKFLRELCRETVMGLCLKVYSIFKDYNVDFPEIKYRAMVSRWGSCQSQGGILTFNYALVHAPLPCIEYVVMHEFTHFLHPDHSKAFYDRLTAFMPDWKNRKQALDRVIICK